MFLRILSIVFPIFIIVALGFVYGRKRMPDMAAANALNMTVFLPALIFSSMASRSFELGQYGDLALGVAVVTLGSGVLGWPLGRTLGWRAGTWLPPLMFNNVGNMGLPLMLLTFGAPALGAALVMLLVATLLQFGLTPLLMRGRMPVPALLRQPVMLAALVGWAISVLEVTVWPPVLVATRLLGDISIGLMIFALGVRLGTAHVSAWGVGLAAAVACPVTGMAMAWAWGTLSGMDAQTLDMLIIFGALPPAVSNFIFAERFNQEPDKVASMVLIGNAVAVVFLPLALAWRL